MDTEMQSGILKEETISEAQRWQSQTVSAEMDPQIQTQPKLKYEHDSDMIKPVFPSDLFEDKRLFAPVHTFRDREHGCKGSMQFVSSSDAAGTVETFENEEEFDGMKRSVESVVGVCSSFLIH